MYQTTFDIVTLIMRYWFAFVIAVVVLRLAKTTLGEYAKQRTAKRREPSETLGWLEIVEPEDDARFYGQSFVLRKENMIGSSSKSDIMIKLKGVKNMHANITQKGNKAVLSRYNSRREIYLNGERIGMPIELYDGDEIAIGECLLVFNLDQLGDEYDEFDDEHEDEYDDEDEEENRLQQPRQPRQQSVPKNKLAQKQIKTANRKLYKNKPH